MASAQFTGSEVSNNSHDSQCAQLPPLTEGALPNPQPVSPTCLSTALEMSLLTAANPHAQLPKPGVTQHHVLTCACRPSCPSCCQTWRQGRCRPPRAAAGAATAGLPQAPLPLRPLPALRQPPPPPAAWAPLPSPPLGCCCCWPADEGGAQVGWMALNSRDGMARGSN